LGQALYYEERLGIGTKEWEEGKQRAVRTCVLFGRTWLAHSELGMGHEGWSSWVHGGSLGVGKVKADGLEVRNLMKSPMHGDGRDTLSFANLGQSVRM